MIMRLVGGLRAAVVGTVTGLTVTFVGVSLYSLLARINLRYGPDLPWGPVVAVPLLWLYWRWLGGLGWPKFTREYRRRMRRAKPIPRGTAYWVAGAGLAGFVAAGSAMTLGFRLASLPPDALRAPPAPIWTLIPVVVMLSLVAGVCEEVGLRGYIQKPLEETGFPLAAIIWSALVFVLLHSGKQWIGAQAAPMFVAAVWYGYYTARSDSIYPMIVVHTLLDIVALGYVMVLGGSPPRSVHQDGLTLAFWINLAVTVVAFVLAFGLTARIAKSSSVSPEGGQTDHPRLREAEGLVSSNGN